MLIHVARGQQTLGAFDVAELKKKINAGDILLDDLSWTEGDAEWSKLSSLIASKSISLDTPESQALTTQIGKAILSVGGVITGTIAHSKHDRVGIVSGGGGGSYGCTMYQGTGSANASFSFTISTEIDVRHEFWLRQEDGLETQFVFPTHIPLADNQEVRMSSLCLSGKVIGIYLKNLTSNQSCVILVSGSRSGELIKDDGMLSAFGVFVDDVISQAFATELEFAKAYPKVYQEAPTVHDREPIWAQVLTIVLVAGAGYLGYKLWFHFESWGWSRILGVPILTFVAFAAVFFVFMQITGLGNKTIHDSEKVEAHIRAEKTKIVLGGYRYLLKLK